MGKVKSDKEVQKEIAALKEMKPFVRSHSMFGDSNHDKIDAQIKALEDMNDESDADDEWPDESDNEVRMCATDALQWKLGQSEARPSKDWASLDSRKQKSSGGKRDA